MRRSSARAVLAVLAGLLSPLPLTSWAAAQEVAAPSYSLSIPTITLEGSSMTEAQVRELFSANMGKQVDAVTHLRADSIAIPKLVFKNTDAAGRVFTLRYKDILLTHARGATVETMTIGSQQWSGPDGSGELRNVVETGVDIGRLFSYLGMSDNSFYQRLYSNLAKTSAVKRVKLEAGPLACRLDDVNLGAVKLRAPQPSVDQFNSARKRYDADPTDISSLRTVIAFVVDATLGLRTDPMSAGVIDCADAAKTSRIEAGGLAIAAYRDAVLPSISTDALSVVLPKREVSADHVEVKAIDLSAALKLVSNPKTKVSAAWFAAHGRDLLPTIGGLSARGVDIKLGTGKTAQQLALDSVDLGFSDYLRGVPRAMSASFDGLWLPVSRKPTDAFGRMLKSLGIDELAVDGKVQSAWNSTDRTITVSNGSFKLAGLGEVTLSASLGKAAPALFSDDPKVAGKAANRLTLQTVIVGLVDKGGSESLLPDLAEKAGLSVEDYRAKMSAQAEGAIIATFGRDDGTRRLARAVGDFIAGTTTRLTLTITAKDEAGVPLKAWTLLKKDASNLVSLVTVAAK